MNLNLDGFTLTGIVMWIASFCILLFQGIAKAMEKGEEYTNIILCDFAYDLFDAISLKIPFTFLQNGFDYIVFEMSLFLLLMIVGTIFLIIGMFVKE